MVQSAAGQELGAEELAEIEIQAVEMVREAGTMALESFRRPLHIEFKDDHLWDPVTNVDREVENFLRSTITERFPGHAVLGEEGTDLDGSVQNLVWVLDPLDGTTNFLNGLPLFACSAALLRNGAPVVGAMFLPVAPRPALLDSRDESAGGLAQASPMVGYSVVHARAGGGAYLDGAPVFASDAEKPHPASLTGFPGFHARQLRRTGELAGSPGELRSLGSICFETAMVAVGVLRYAVFRMPAIWDVAAGSLIVREAGGEALIWRRGAWQPVTSFEPMPNPKNGTERNLRYWRAPTLVGGRKVASFVSERLRPKHTLAQQLAGAFSRLLTRR